MSLTPLPALSVFSSHWAALSSLGIMAFTLSYSILFGPVWMSSLGSLLFSEKGIEGGVGLGER